MKLIVVEIDTSAELDDTECAEVAVRSSLTARTTAMAVVGGWSAATTEGASTSGARGSGKAAPASGSGGGDAGEQSGQNPSCDRERGCTAYSVT
jgi:hypothetical protein